MNARSMERLEWDLSWGCHFWLLKLKHHAYGFRGNAKGQGFSALLKAENIPRRRAYRLIERYLQMEAMWDRVTVTKRELMREILGPLPTAEEFSQAVATEARRQARRDARMLRRTARMLEADRMKSRDQPQAGDHDHE